MSNKFVESLLREEEQCREKDSCSRGQEQLAIIERRGEPFYLRCKDGVWFSLKLRADGVRDSICEGKFYLLCAEEAIAGFNRVENADVDLSFEQLLPEDMPAVCSRIAEEQLLQTDGYHIPRTLSDRFPGGYEMGAKGGEKHILYLGVGGLDIDGESVYLRGDGEPSDKGIHSVSNKFSVRWELFSCESSREDREEYDDKQFSHFSSVRFFSSSAPFLATERSG